MFDNASQVNIAPSHFFNARGDIVINAPELRPKQEDRIPITHLKGFDLLRHHSSIGSMLDADERFDPPKCSEETRKCIIDDIIGWANSHSRVAEVVWLVGPVGAGKSALAQSLAELCKKDRNLASALFISRTAPSPNRSDGHRIIPTTVLQLVDTLPDIRPFVENVISEDPTIFQMNRAIQLEELVLKPLQKWTVPWLLRKLGLISFPRVIVIDGLDECHDKAIQVDLVHLMAVAVLNLGLPFRILICSRPEAHIIQAFSEAFRDIEFKKVDLAIDPNIDADLMNYLRQVIAEIRRSHPLKDDLDPNWPSDDAISLIVKKSSPQFIYAAVVSRYISDPDFRPDRRLQIILKAIAEPPSDKPYASLDRLYSFIFRSIPEANRESVNNILSILHLSGLSGYEHLARRVSPEEVEDLLRLDRGDVKRVLRPLSSLLDVPQDRDDNIKVYHASLFDYLTDSTRSGELHLKVRSCHVLLAAYCLDNLFDDLSVHPDLCDPDRDWDSLSEATVEIGVSADSESTVHDSFIMNKKLFAFIGHWSNGVCDDTAVCRDFRDFLLKYGIWQNVDGENCKREIARLVHHLRLLQKTRLTYSDARNLVAFILQCTAYKEALLQLSLRCSCLPVNPQDYKSDPDFSIFEPTLEILKIETDDFGQPWCHFGLNFQYFFTSFLRSTMSLVELDVSDVLHFPLSILDYCASLKRLSTSGTSVIKVDQHNLGAPAEQVNPRRILDYLSIRYDLKDSVQTVLRWFRYSSARYSYDGHTIVEAAGRNLTQEEIHRYTINYTNGAIVEESDLMFPVSPSFEAPSSEPTASNKIDLGRTTYQDMTLNLPRLSKKKDHYSSLISNDSMYSASSRQPPRCEGVEQDRLFFRAKAPPRPAIYPIKPVPQSLIIRLGEASGITRTTEFTIHARPKHSPALAMARVLELAPFFTTLECVSGHEITDRTKEYYAQRGCRDHYVKILVDESTGATLQLDEKGKSALDSLFDAVFVTHDTARDHQLAFVNVDNTLIFTFRDTISTKLRLTYTHQSSALGVSVDDIQRLLAAACHFYANLRAQDGPKRSPRTPAISPSPIPQLQELARKIKIEFHRVATELSGNLAYRRSDAKNLYDKEHDQIKVTVYEGIPIEAPAYRLRITNPSDTPFYAWVFFFNCKAMSIKTWYKPFSTSSPCLQANGGSIAIGGGSSSTAPLVFTLRRGEKRDVGFLKIYFSTEYVDLTSVAQDTPFEPGTQRTDAAPLGSPVNFWASRCIPVIQTAAK